jgi:hypothetical protein
MVSCANGCKWLQMAAKAHVAYAERAKPGSHGV